MIFRINQTDIETIGDMAAELKRFAAKFDDAAYDCKAENPNYAAACLAVRDILLEASADVNSQQPSLLELDE
jgi:hypothetical protein